MFSLNANDIMTYLLRISKALYQYHSYTSEPRQTKWLYMTSHRAVGRWLHYIHVCFFRHFSFAFSHFSYSFISLISLPIYCLPFFKRSYFVSISAFNFLVFPSNFHTFSVAFTRSLTLRSLYPFICPSLPYSTLICVPRSNFFLPVFIF